MLKQGGFRKQIAGFNVERIGNTARSLALGRYCYETARQWAMTRKQFGRQLAEFQGLQWKFADMKVKLDAGQLLLYRAAVNADTGMPSAEDTAIAKVFCNQAASKLPPKDAAWAAWATHRTRWSSGASASAAAG